MGKNKIIKTGRKTKHSSVKISASKSVFSTPLTQLSLTTKIIIAVFALFIMGSIYQVFATGSGPFSFLASRGDINRISQEAGDTYVHSTPNKPTYKPPTSIAESKCKSKGPKWEWDGKDCVNISTNQVVTGTSATPIQKIVAVDPKNTVRSFCKVGNSIYDLYQDIPLDDKGNCRKCAPPTGPYGIAKPAATISKCQAGNTFRFKCAIFRNPNNGLWSQREANGFTERSSKEIGQKISGKIDGIQTDVVCTKTGWKDF